MEVVMGETGDKEENEPRLFLWVRRRLTGVTGSWACEVDARGTVCDLALLSFVLHRQACDNCIRFINHQAHKTHATYWGTGDIPGQAFLTKECR